MASAIFFVLASAALATARHSYMSSVRTEQGEVDQNSPHILDDMRFVEGQLEQAKAVGIPAEQLRWTSKMVPYVLDFSVAAYAGLLAQAFQEYHTKTCITFVPRSVQRNYIRIFAGQGCYSNVGMIGGQQAVSLGQGCMFKGTVVHELGHALGFFHEQNRSDRDDYVTIYWENIQQGMESQFAKLQPNQETTLNTTYDYGSIMQYGNYAFSKDGRTATMVAENSTVVLTEPYDKPGLSSTDALAMNKMYDC